MMTKICCASGLVAKFNIPIVEPRVRFPAGAGCLILQYSVGGYHRSLSRSKPGFESQYRKSFLTYFRYCYTIVIKGLFITR